MLLDTIMPNGKKAPRYTAGSHYLRAIAEPARQKELAEKRIDQAVAKIGSPPVREVLTQIQERVDRVIEAEAHAAEEKGPTPVALRLVEPEPPPHATLRVCVAACGARAAGDEAQPCNIISDWTSQ